jgi:glyoxalase family protein
MENRILGIHHITAIAGNAIRNYQFYTGVLGLRLVKKTVNFDDPSTYHLYYGDGVGSPGSILTFFPWEGIKKGKIGNGMATEITYSVGDGSLHFWKERLNSLGVDITLQGKRFDDEYLSFLDPDGLPVTLIVPNKQDNRIPWTTEGLNSSVATKGIHSITINLRNADATVKILTDIFQYTFVGKDGARSRYKTNAIEHASIIDIIEMPDGKPGVGAGGTIHHIAFRVEDERTQQVFRDRILSYGLEITNKIDRNYFFSLYFREPGGVLFEIATDTPGFAVDESVEGLGLQLMLPPQYESGRKEIESFLPQIN